MAVSKGDYCDAAAPGAKSSGATAQSTLSMAHTCAQWLHSCDCTLNCYCFRETRYSLLCVRAQAACSGTAVVRVARAWRTAGWLAGLAMHISGVVNVLLTS
jgi:hypothetical protein